MAKWDLSQEDLDDYEQEKQIQEWLARSGNKNGIDLVHINSKGNARNTRVRASVSLDQEIQTDSKGTFADLIAGHSDGSSSLGRPDAENPRDAAATLDGYLALLGFNEEDTEWLIEKLKSSDQMRKTRLRRYRIDSESWELLTNLDE